MIKYGSTCLLLLLTLCRCVPPEITLWGDLAGIVSDAETSEPISQVTLKLNPTNDSTVTDEDGLYLFHKINPGDYDIEATKQAYEVVAKDITVESGLTTEINFDLTKVPFPEISRDFLDYGLDLTTITFTISNSGSGTVVYSLSTFQEWIAISSTNGEVSTETDSITVSIDRGSLSEEMHQGVINVSLSVSGVTQYEQVGVYVNGAVDRDGNFYRAVVIGSQIWMAENLNVGNLIMLDNVNWPQDDGIIEKFCYDNLESNCDIYGGLYTWSELTNHTSPDTAIIGTIQGICPDRWHIPTEEDFSTLEETLGGSEIAGGKLKDTTSLWLSPNFGATNESGFTALPAGNVYFANTVPGPTEFKWIGVETSFWTSYVEFNYDRNWYTAFARRCLYNDDILDTSSGTLGQIANSVRCIKDPD